MIRRMLPLFAALPMLAACQDASTAGLGRTVQAAALCPKPGSSVSFVRSDNGASAGTYTYLAPTQAEESGLCVVRQGPDRRTILSPAARIILPAVAREHAQLVAALQGASPGASSLGYMNLPEFIGQRSMQVQVEYRALEEERISVPAGQFDTILLEERERNGTCVSIFQAWIDRKTMLPVRRHQHNQNCTPVRQFDAVASSVKPAG